MRELLCIFVLITLIIVICCIHQELPQQQQQQQRRRQLQWRPERLRPGWKQSELPNPMDLSRYTKPTASRLKFKQKPPPAPIALESHHLTNNSLSSGNSTGKYRYRYFVSVMLIVKNEQEMILEFVKHYLEEGIDHFFIFDDDSTDATFRFLKNCVDEKRFSIYTRSTIGIKANSEHDQRAIYSRLYSVIRKVTKWLVVVDVDELIVSRTRPELTIRQWLQTSFSDCLIVSIPWLIYSWGNQSATPIHHVREALLYRWGYDATFSKQLKVVPKIIEPPHGGGGGNGGVGGESIGGEDGKLQSQYDSSSKRTKMEEKMIQYQRSKDEKKKKRMKEKKQKKSSRQQLKHFNGANDSTRKRKLLASNLHVDEGIASAAKFRDRHTAVENKVIFQTAVVTSFYGVHHAVISHIPSSFRSGHIDYHDSLFNDLQNNIQQKDEEQILERNLLSDHQIHSYHLRSKRASEAIRTHEGLVCIAHQKEQLSCNRERDLLTDAFARVSSIHFDNETRFRLAEQAASASLSDGDSLAYGMCPKYNRYYSTHSLPRTALREADIDDLQLAVHHYRIKSESDWQRKMSSFHRAYSDDYRRTDRSQANRVDVYDPFIPKVRNTVRSQHPTPWWLHIQQYFNSCSIFNS